MNIKNIFKANEQVATLTKSNEEWAKKYEALETEKLSLEESIENYLIEKESHTKAIEDLKADYEAKIASMTADKEKQITNLETTVKETAQSVEEKAVDLMASIGLAPETIKVAVNTEVVASDVYNKWMTLCKTDTKAADEYYKINRSTLIKYTGYNVVSK